MNTMQVSIQKERATSVSRYGQQTFIATRLYAILPEYKTDLSSYIQEVMDRPASEKFMSKLWKIAINKNLEVSKKEAKIQSMVDELINTNS